MISQPTPEDVTSSDRIGSIMPLGQDQKSLSSTGQSFSSFMGKQEMGSIPGSMKTSLTSPFELAQQGGRPLAGGPNFETLLAQVQLAQNTMGDLQNQLSYPNLKLKASHKYILKNKLSDANQNIRSVNAKLNLPLSNEEEEGKGPEGPIEKFLRYVSDGMTQLESAKKQLSDLKDKGQSLTPADFLLIQIKLNKAQQEIDFSSVLLSNAVSSFKMLMNIQL